MSEHHDHNHDHDHDHSRTFQPDHPEPRSYHQLMGLALRDLLIEKGHYTAQEEREMIEKMSNANPGNGGKMVAKAWLDPDYKALLLSNGNAACEAVGIDPGPTEFTVLENTDSVHNVVVCTLCSCYPRGILGMSPAWYKSNNYRSRVVREPRKVLEEFDTHLDEAIEVRVHDSTAELRYMIMPQRPAGTEGWSEEDLTKIVTRDSMIGVQRDLEI
ncbi:nitrile hydratase subunit alpha [Rhodovibrionaceae bacterium A322]